MRCPKCSTKYVDNVGRTCEKCKYKFVIDSKTEGLNDVAFQKILDSMGSDVYFTSNQLYSHYLSMGKVPLMLKVICWSTAIFSFILLLYPALVSNKPYAPFLSVGCFAIAMTAIFNMRPSKKIARDKFEEILTHWHREQPIAELITKPNLHEAPPGFSELDIYNYGVEGVIIVDQDIYVDLFVLNSYQSEWKSVIISQNAYPNYLTEQVQKVINENPAIKIYYLHDSETSVPVMKQRVRSFLKLPSTVEELDMGVSEGDANKLDIFKERNNEDGGIKLDFLPPARLAETMGMALIGGLLLSEVLNTYKNRSNYTSDFG